MGNCILGKIRPDVLCFFVSIIAALTIAAVNVELLTRGEPQRLQPNRHSSLSSSGITGSGDDEEAWAKVKSNLCQHSVPQLKLGAVLFELARREIGLERPRRNKKEENQFVRSFFQSPPGIVAYKPPGGEVSVLYINNKKAASTQIKYHFLATGLEREERLREEDKRTLQTLSRRERQKDDACIITAIRDPIERFLSGYSELEQRTATETKYNNTVSQMPVGYKMHQYGETNRFEQLVEDFLSDPGFLHAKKAEQDFGELLRHLWSQTRILICVAELGMQLTSYLPTIKNITQEWPKFVIENCPSAIEHYLESQPMKLLGQHKSSKDPLGFRRAANAVWAEGGRTARALCALHAMEYACWDNLPDGVPELCRDVYSSQHFAETIRNVAKSNVSTSPPLSER